MKHTIQTIFLLLALTAISGCSWFSETKKQTDILSAEELQTLKEILEILDMTIAEAKDEIREKPDPTSPTRMLLEKLERRRDYLNKIIKGEISYDRDAVLNILDEIKVIKTNIDNPVELVLEADVSFELGKYKVSDLSEEGRRILDRFTRDVIEVLMKKQKEIFPDKPFVIFIKTIGYADEAFPGYELTNDLIKDSIEYLPKDTFERRQILNIELSYRRARSINEYIRSQMEPQMKNLDFKIGNPEIVGLGEQFPYPSDTVSPPYQAQDIRRRICKIHGNVFIGE